MTEYEIQKYIWDKRDNWADLIIQIDFPQKYTFNDDEHSLNTLSPDKIIYNELISRIEDIYSKIIYLKLFGCEVPLKKTGDSTIRADLLGLIEGNPGIALIEIKKSAQTERQAYTELLAYASHLHSIFPTISKDDIRYILISPMKERIVREATIHSFLFDEKPVFALIPSWSEGDITTLKLTPWVPSETEIVNVAESIFSQNNIEIFKVTWDKIEDWNADNGENPSQWMIERMERISSYAAQIMESKGIHGFVYTSQAYPELPLLPNSIIIAGINPFKVAKDNYLIGEGYSPFDINEIPDEAINLLQIIPELANKAKEVNEKENYLHGLIITWSDTITRIAFDTVELMTTNFEKLKFEQGYGGMTWAQYQKILLEDSYGFNYSIRPTGMIRKLYVGYTKEDYDYMNKHGYKEHPFLYHGDIPLFVVDYINKQYYFREFLLRLFDPFHEIRDEIKEEIKQKN